MDDGDGKAALISIQIPDGAEPGDSLCFESNGQNFTIEIPPASAPGEILEIKLASHDNHGDVDMNDSSNEVYDNCNNSTVSIEMSTGSKISVLQNTEAASSDRILSDGTFQLLWPASRFVIDFMNTPEFCKQIQTLCVHSILELGAGHGIFGLAFADVISQSRKTQDAIRLVLTDVEEALPQLETNININRLLFEKRVEISALPLRWHSNPLSQTNGSIDFILGSDLLYNCTVIPSLVATIRRLISKSTRILFSVRWRKPSDERRFFIMLSDIIKWNLIHGACPLDYRTYGNGSYESNKYFSQTMVGVRGSIVPLSSIDESKSEQMTAEEFEQFEDLQTQVYLGEVTERPKNIDHVQKRPKLAA